MTLSKSDALNSAIEHHIRIYELMRTRGMTRSSATVVVDASMYGKGCLEGTIRAQIEERKVARPPCGHTGYCGENRCLY